MSTRDRFDISPTTAFWIVVSSLMICALFFTISVETRRGQWNEKDPELIVEAGEQVEVVQVIDGDEVSVKRGEDVFVVRLLGIKCFSSKVNEPGISQIGAACEATLNRLAAGKTGTVEFDEFKKDKAKRVLAYLKVAETDIGQQLVLDGLALTYTRYPFSREDSYLSAEETARTRARGLWGQPIATDRAKALKAEWKSSREP
ncbi:MAG: thermonuclease family protein [Bradymonadia bacterium]